MKASVITALKATLVTATLSVLAAHVVLSAAEGGPKTDKIYLSEVLEPTVKGKAAYYLQPEGKDGDLFIGKVYTLQGELKAEGRFQDEALMIEEGPFVFFHPNGKIESKGNYAMGYKTGIWERYDKWGQPLAEKVYDHEPLLNIVYSMAEIMPKAPGGDKAFAKNIAEKVKVPPGKEMKKNITASFIVEKTGAISNVKVIDGDSGEVDEQLVEMIKSTQPWQPGAEKGLPVRVEMRMPVQF